MAMRVTNNMIMQTGIKNINSNKTNVDGLYDQMSSQKKISRASEDPVVAIRSLRLRNTQAQVNQYLDKNISDASTWLDNTETALGNMKTALTNVSTELVSVTGTLSLSDKRTVLQNLQSLREELYSSGNADLNGRNLFTGYKTGTTLTFLTADTSAHYTITEKFSYENISSAKYYANCVDVPTSLNGENGSTAVNNPTEVENYRIRLSYADVDAIADSDNIELTDSDGNAIDTLSVTTMSYSDWEAADFAIGDDEVYLIEDTGELILGKDVANQIKSAKAELSFTYDKTGFNAGELKPQNYFDCVEHRDTGDIEYTKADQQIKYTVAPNTTLTVNTQAADVFNADAGRDIDELVNAMQAAVDAETKVSKITSMMTEAQYADDDSQAYLSNLLAAAQKEADYTQDNVNTLFSNGITSFQGYLDDIATAISDVGNKSSQLELIETRVTNQKSTLESLISDNEDMDLSEIAINYTAAYNAYEAALLAASKASKNTLLDYI